MALGDGLKKRGSICEGKRLICSREDDESIDQWSQSESVMGGELSALGP